MFTLQEIKDAHAKVRSGADFPRYIQGLKKLGVTRYDTFVADGHSVFEGENEYQVRSKPKYATLAVADTSNADNLIRDLKIHQQGGTDYPTFCNQAADAGVEKWTVDLKAMTCTYFDKAGHELLREVIPS